MPRRTRGLVLATVAAITVLSSLAAITVRLDAGRRSAPDFTLSSARGGPFTLSQHRGRTVALLFGYTHCPDVCPTTLAALARAKHQLGSSAGAFDVAFITVDPARDTPGRLARYVALFDPAFFGLSGTPAQLNAVYTDYHVYHQQLPNRAGSRDYDVAHSSDIILIGPDGRIRAEGDWDDSPAQLAAEIRRTRA
jgi:protein SCO1/2